MERSNLWPLLLSAFSKVLNVLPYLFLWLENWDLWFRCKNGKFSDENGKKNLCIKHKYGISTHYILKFSSPHIHIHSIAFADSSLKHTFAALTKNCEMEKWWVCWVMWNWHWRICVKVHKLFEWLKSSFISLKYFIR